MNAYQEHLKSAKRHCLLSLLDYADGLKRNEKDKKIIETIELFKKRVHNDIAQFHQIASQLVTISQTGGEIQPLGENGKNNDK